MSKEQVFYTLSKEELLEDVKECVRETIKEYLNPTTGQSDLIKAKAACELLGISKPTLFAWKNAGLISGIYLGTRLYFRRTDLLNAMSERPQIIKKLKKNGNGKC